MSQQISILRCSKGMIAVGNAGLHALVCIGVVGRALDDQWDETTREEEFTSSIRRHKGPLWLELELELQAKIILTYFSQTPDNNRHLIPISACPVSRDRRLWWDSRLSGTSSRESDNCRNVAQDRCQNHGNVSRQSARSRRGRPCKWMPCRKGVAHSLSR